ncbi:hypothetical protein LINPERPRIM_LOCUS34042 [Linum perenne]
MPLYDCVLLLKPHVERIPILSLLTRIGNHVATRNGVVTEIKSFGKINLGYGIKKLDGRFFQGQLVQMTMMATPNMNKELHYLNKEDQLLRWLLTKHRNTVYSLNDFDEDTGKNGLRKYTNSGSIFDGTGINVLDDDLDYDSVDEEDDDAMTVRNTEARMKPY